MLALFALACPIFAQTGAPAAAPASSVNWIALTAGFAMAIASGLCALGQGRAVGSAVEGMARNPGATKAIQAAMILGLAFIESLALFTLVIIFVKVV
ncbi:MAG TPA: ATPase [Solibacterales bacterium]|nr:ATPase [Bryobacterales bacterium]